MGAGITLHFGAEGKTLSFEGKVFDLRGLDRDELFGVTKDIVAIRFGVKAVSRLEKPKH
jgi:hypothetical protein